MSVEFILAFFLMRHLIKILKTFDPHSKWIKIFKTGLYVSVILFVIDMFLRNNPLVWIGHLMVFGIALLVFRGQLFTKARQVIYAVLPFMILALAGDICDWFAHTFYQRMDDYFDIANIFAIIWMVAMLMISGKQNKALEAERKKTQQEEEQNRWITARKAELEKEVIERTAEITQQKEELQHALVDLKATQAQLIQQEKLASLGELTAGIAHEIQNPLNFVNNFSEVSSELVTELQDILSQKLPVEDKKYANEILFDLTRNLEKITHHGKRADSIVKGMLLHSRNGISVKQPTNLNALADEYLRLSYHGLRAKDKSFNAQLVTHFDGNLPKIQLASQEIGRVLLNLYNNAFYSLSKKKKEHPQNFSPTLTISIKCVNSIIEIRVRDNGNGIPQNVIEKIYQPFFTTKPAGEGIGLGLSLSYDIIKTHGGELKVESKEGEYAEFIILLPFKEIPD